MSKSWFADLMMKRCADVWMMTHARQFKLQTCSKMLLRLSMGPIVNLSVLFFLYSTLSYLIFTFITYQQARTSTQTRRAAPLRVSALSDVNFVIGAATVGTSCAVQFLSHRCIVLYNSINLLPSLLYN